MKSEFKQHRSFSISTPSSLPSRNLFETTSSKEKPNCCLLNYKIPSPISLKKKSISSTQTRKSPPKSFAEMTTTTKTKMMMKSCLMWLIFHPRHVVQFTNVGSVNWLHG